MKTVFKILLGIIAVPYLILVIFLTTCLLNYNDYNITEFNGKTLLIIKDNDLEPSFKKGDLVVVPRNENKEVKRGDSIFFYDNYKNQVSVNLGKVIDTEKVTDRESTFTVEGDHPVSSEFFIGKKDTSTVYSGVGSILGALESRMGYLFTVVFPILLLFIYEVYAVIMEIKQPLEDEDDE